MSSIISVDITPASSLQYADYDASRPVTQFHPLTQYCGWYIVDGARMTAKVPALPIGELGSKDPSKTILTVPFLIPSTRLLQISLGRMDLSNKTVGSLTV